MLLVYAHHNESIKDVTVIFQQVLQVSDELVLEFSNFIVEDNCSEMIRILLKCPDPTARECVSDILSTTINRLFELEGDLLDQYDEIEGK